MHHHSSAGPSKRSTGTLDFETSLRSRIVGQEEGVQALVELVPGFLRGIEFAGPPGGEPFAAGSDGFGKNAHRGSRRGNSVWRCARGYQGGLRGISALARNRQIDWLAPRISGAPRDAPLDHPGRAGEESYRQIEAVVPAVRRNRESLGLAVAIAAGDAGQGHADAGRQPQSGPFADGHFPDLQPGRRGNYRDDARRPGIRSADRQAHRRTGQESRADGDGSGAAQIFAGIHEPAGQGGGVPSVAARTACRKFCKSSWATCSGACWKPPRASFCFV